MQLGPAVTHLAEILNYPEPSAQVIKRFMRERGWTTKGARGRNAPHVTSTELAALIIAMMLAEQPGFAVERLPHFAALEHDDRYPGKTFSEVLALCLDRLAGEDWKVTMKSGWSVTIHINWSMAEIDTKAGTMSEDGEPLAVHAFDSPADQGKPFFRGIERSARLNWIELTRAAKIILAGEPDPFPEILDTLAPEVNA